MFWNSPVSSKEPMPILPEPRLRSMACRATIGADADADRLLQVLTALTNKGEESGEQ
jgi:hypothetical protein